ncbi:serine/threonine-protein kinase [Streptomyces sp. TLI_185]|uniref:serine/threonine-protein kinase n=1 Tax=Streptomyces sp. TLI_185 TaxID=2485151 RepID=UPI000F4F33AF|nr:serine/threonine-protein kinase [Streptomyces sp. TLI_185]RPF31326.1 serine/threonine protein kinase [Streptomyces sp. TLI_185]
MSSGETSGGNNKGDGTGRVLAGRYRVVAQLGRGGMGVVWRAVDEVLGREVAVKELRTYTDADGPELADLRLRMQREARAAARVRHPGVVAVHDVTEVDGRPLIVMELVDGPSLEQVLRERGSLDPVEAAGIGAKVMDALAAAHRAGVLHRDVKPGNILLEGSGRVVLTDFGIAAMDEPGDGAATRLTRSGALVGSLDYLAPERAQGAEASPASDVWALGATLYAAVEGSSPFRRTSTYSTLTAIVSEPLPEPERAGLLTPVLQQLLDKRPETRPEAEQGRALLQAVADAGGTDTPTTTLRDHTAPRAETEPDVPSLPPGFFMPGAAQGPAPAAQDSAPTEQRGPVTPGSAPAGQHDQAAPGLNPTPYAAPAMPGFGPPASQNRAPDLATAPTGPIPPSTSPRHKGRALLAAVAVTVVLAAAGGTVALLNSRNTAANAHPTSSSTEAQASASVSDRTDADHSDGPKPTEQGDKKSPTPTKADGQKSEATPTSRASSSSTAKSPGGGTTGGGTTGGTSSGGTTGGGSGGTTGGGGETTPAPACTSIGGGKYNCTVWRTAKSYTASGTEVGVLGAGTNYFYCQQNLGRRETYGQWTNVWWAKTDDDSGNTNVYISDVYIKGGDNDQPIPGLPVC